MVGHFVSLKLRLLRNGMTGNRSRVASFVIGLLVAVPTGVLVFIGFAMVRTRPAARFDVAVLSFSGLALCWIVGPLLYFRADSTLDPAPLVVLPLTRRDLISGLTAASCVGVIPLACFIGATGVVAGYAPRSPSALLVVAAVLVELAFCIIASRALSTFLAGLLRSRKARDLTVLITALLGLALRFASELVAYAVDPKHKATVDRVASWVSWSPPGLAARAVVEASAGHPLRAVSALVASLGCVVIAAMAWSAALEHLMTSSDTTTARRPDARAAALASPLFGRFLTWLPPNRRGAIAARELRYYWRDPKRRAAIVSFVPILLLPAAGLFSGHLQKTYVLGLAGLGYFITVTLDNQFGILGAGYAFQVVTAHDPEADFYGTTLAALVVSLGAVGAVTLVVAAILGAWAYLPATLLMTLGVTGVHAGIGANISARAPQALAVSRNSFATAGGGQGCSRGFIVFGGMAVEAVFALPVIALGFVFAHRSSISLTVAAAVAAGYGLIVAQIGIQVATRWVSGRLPELLQAISPKQAI